MARSRSPIQARTAVSNPVKTVSHFHVRRKSSLLTSLERKHRSPSRDTRGQSPDSARSVQSTENIKPRSRGKSNTYTRDGVSRRQAKRDRARNPSPPTTIGHLGKHKLHY